MKIIFNRDLEKDTLNEIELMKNLDCPNIIKYYDHISEKNKLFYLFIEYCPVRKLLNIINLYKLIYTHCFSIQLRMEI